LLLCFALPFVVFALPQGAAFAVDLAGATDSYACAVLAQKNS
jgi:hypothetical protein